MKTLITGSLLAAACGTALAVATPTPATAQLARPQTAIGISGGASDLLTDVHYRGRGGHGGGFRGGYGRGWHGGHHGFRGGYGRGWHGGHWRGGYGRHYGPGIGLGLGLATGAIIGSAIAAPYYYAPPPPVVYQYGPGNSDAVAYCMQRFRSYDPASGTYLGYDGLRHPCP